MGKRSNNSEGGSLDLLLDTICNTFGGIILIALLVVILLSTTTTSETSEPVSKESQLELAKNELERQKLTGQLQELQQALDLQGESLGNVTEEMKEMVEKYRELEKEKSEKIVQNSEAVGKTNQAQEEINDFAEKQADLDERKANAKKRKQEAEKELAKAFEENASEVTIRSVKRSSLPQRYYFLMDGQLYGPAFKDGLGSARNTREFRFTKEGDTTYVDPLPEAGEAVPDEYSSIAPMKSKFNGVSSKKYNIRLFVWQESFGRYAPVRSAMEELGLRTELVLLKDGDRVFLTSDDSSSNDVQ